MSPPTQVLAASVHGGVMGNPRGPSRLIMGIAGGHVGVLGGRVEISRSRRGARGAHGGAARGSGRRGSSCPELSQPTVFACISLVLAASVHGGVMGNPRGPSRLVMGIAGGHVGVLGGRVEISRSRRGARGAHGGAARGSGRRGSSCPELSQPTVFACSSLVLAASVHGGIMGNPRGPSRLIMGIAGAPAGLTLGPPGAPLVVLFAAVSSGVRCFGCCCCFVRCRVERRSWFWLLLLLLFCSLPCRAALSR
eukprot:gene11984-biopygen1328